MNDVSALKDMKLAALQTLSPTVRGYIDGIVGDALAGWAFCPERPGNRVLAQVVVDGQFVAEAVADLFRDDLLKANIGDGYHGFMAPLPPHLLDGREHSVNVVEAETQAVLVSSSNPVTFPASQRKRQISSVQDLYTLFDAGFYCMQAGDVPDGLLHYTTEGWRQGYDPHPLFNTDHYVRLYGNQITDDPLKHFFNEGCYRLYSTHPLFDIEYYLQQRPDVENTGQHPLLHYLTFGWKEAVVASKFFDEKNYDANTLACGRMDLSRSYITCTSAGEREIGRIRSSIQLCSRAWRACQSTGSHSPTSFRTCSLRKNGAQPLPSSARLRFP